MKRRILFALVMVIVFASTMTIFASASEARTYLFRETDINYLNTSNNILIDTAESEYLTGKFSFVLPLVIDNSSNPDFLDSLTIQMNEFLAVGALFNDGFTDRYRFLQIFAQDGIGFAVGFTTVFEELLWGWCFLDQIDDISALQMVGLYDPVEIEGIEIYLDVEAISMTTELLPPEEISDESITYRAIYQLYDWRIPPEEGALKVVDFYKNLTNAFLTSTEALWGAEWTQMHNYFAVFFGAFLVASVASWITFYIKRRR